MDAGVASCRLSAATCKHNHNNHSHNNNNNNCIDKTHFIVPRLQLSSVRTIHIQNPGKNISNTIEEKWNRESRNMAVICGDRGKKYWVREHREGELSRHGVWTGWGGRVLWLSTLDCLIGDRYCEAKNERKMICQREKGLSMSKKSESESESEWERQRKWGREREWKLQFWPT